MRNQTEVLECIRNANIKDEMWLDNLMDQMENSYAKGYLMRSIEILGENFASSDEEFRERLIEIAEYDIWK